ncbi:MAG TPA: SIR2 family protein, partial [Pirellulales bacterium]|nr:SIR2 family protein [Pirellulales bacterium]
LHLTEFDPERGNAFMTMLGTRVGTMYTTNQDNLVELCFAAYGHRLSVVIDIDDIAQLRPGDVVLYKFHGDLTEPDSIVFAKEDYARRGPTSDFELDIRLRSDALAKSLLFLGYSFRDPNVKDLFGHLQRLFKGRLPPSYLVQFQSNAAFAQQLKDEFGITAIDPTTLYPGCDAPSAFDRFLTDLRNATLEKKAKQELDDMFAPSVPPARRVVARHEIDAVDAVLASGTGDEVLRAFRSTYDTALIHETFDERVSTQFVEICRRVEHPEQVGQIRGSVFNLHLTDARCAMAVLAAAHATVNVLPIPQGTGLNWITFISPNLDESIGVFAVATAIGLLREWGRSLSPAFYHHVARWDLRGWPTRAELAESLGDEVSKAIIAEFDFAYSRGKTTYQHPLHRAEYLKGKGLRDRFGAPTYGETLRSLHATFPKKLSKPLEG